MQRITSRSERDLLLVDKIQTERVTVRACGEIHYTPPHIKRNIIVNLGLFRTPIRLNNFVVYKIYSRFPRAISFKITFPVY